MVELIDVNYWTGDARAAGFSFDCGIREINDYLRERLEDLTNLKNERLLILADSEIIFGFISLGIDTIRTVAFEKRTYPVLVINAIGIDKHSQGQGYGTQLLLSAFRLSLNIHQVVPIDGVYLVALRDAVEFYEKFDIKNLNAPPEWVPNQMEFQMTISIDLILSLEVEPYQNIDLLK